MSSGQHTFNEYFRAFKQTVTATKWNIGLKNIKGIKLNTENNHETLTTHIFNNDGP